MRTLALAVLTVALAAGTATAADDITVLMPKSQEVSGWAVTADAQAYPGKKIFDMIDGAGEVYMDYNFEVAASAEYSEPKGGVIDIEIYKMKTPEDAYGIYAYNRPAKYDAVEAPQAAFVSGITGGLWKDTYYVKVYGLEDKSGVADAVKEFIKLESSRIATEGTLPNLVQALDVEGFKKGSARFLRSPLALKNLHFVSEENVLNLGPDTQMVFGDYSLRGRDFQAFIVLYPTQEAATAAASKYAVYLGAHPEAEAAWLKQMGKVVVGTWTNLKVPETQDIQDMLFETIQSLLDRVRMYDLRS